jgi:hypothetical protein
VSVASAPSGQPRRDLRAGAEAQLVQDAADVGVDGVLGDEQRPLEQRPGRLAVGRGGALVSSIMPRL